MIEDVATGTEEAIGEPIFAYGPTGIFGQAPMTFSTDKCRTSLARSMFCIEALSADNLKSRCATNGKASRRFAETRSTNSARRLPMHLT